MDNSHVALVSLRTGSNNIVVIDRCLLAWIWRGLLKFSSVRRMMIFARWRLQMRLIYLIWSTKLRVSCDLSFVGWIYYLFFSCGVVVMRHGDSDPHISLPLSLSLSLSLSNQTTIWNKVKNPELPTRKKGHLLKTMRMISKVLLSRWTNMFCSPFL